MAARKLGTLLLANVVAMILLATAVHAEPAMIGQDTQGQSANRPARGMTMVRVESIFGQPLTKYSAVGEPPITRWEYDGFVVYFEYQHVIHAVDKREST